MTAMQKAITSTLRAEARMGACLRMPCGMGGWLHYGQDSRAFTASVVRLPLGANSIGSRGHGSEDAGGSIA